MKWILLYWLLSGPSNFAPTGTAVFDDESACRGALKEIAATFQGDTKGAPGICVPQATDEPAPAPRAPVAPTVATAPKARP